MDSDEALYKRVREGDMSAFSLLYERYEGPLFGFLMSQLKNRADAEDVFHEAFLSALKSREATFTHEGGSFRGYIFRVARNAVLNRARSAKRGSRALENLPELEEPPNAEHGIEGRELAIALSTAVTKLPPVLSELYHLRSSGLRYEEMAEALEIPLGTIKSRMSQMVHHLREELRPWIARLHRATWLLITWAPSPKTSASGSMSTCLVVRVVSVVTSV